MIEGRAAHHRMIMVLLAGAVGACSQVSDSGSDDDVTTETALGQPTGSGIFPEVDTYVRSGAYADQSFGTESAVQADLESAGTVKKGFIRFQIGDVGAFTKATLRVYVTNASSKSATVVTMSNTTWSEQITWNTRPASDGDVVATIGATKSGTWVDVDVTSAVKPNSPLSLAIVGASSDGFSFASRETTNAPRLILDGCASCVADGGAPPDGGPGTGDGGVSNDAGGGGGGGGPVKAFPTAEGFGAQTRGAYGAGVAPTIYKVTNLTDPATRTANFDGSLRWALEASEPRIIVFAVSGYIFIKSRLVVTNPYLNVEAQTAPGDGIALRNDPANGVSTFRIATHDVIVRHLRIRPGRANPGVIVDTQEALEVGATNNTPTYNVVVDHCSTTWGIDGNAQTGNLVHDVTFQWNIISEGLNNAGHSKGNHSRALELYVGDRDTDVDVNGRISIHHNLMSHVEYRVPQISLKNGMTEVINNVVYHTTQMGISVNANAHGVMGDSKNRLVRNYLLRTATAHNDIRITAGDIASGEGHLPGVLVHLKGNVGPTRLSDTLPDVLSLDTETTPGCTTCYSTNPATQHNHYTADPLCTASNGAFPYPDIRVVEDTAQAALEKVSGTGAYAGQALVGATKPLRDPVDTRILKQLTNYIANPNATNTVPVPGGPNGGLLDDPAQVGGYPTLASGPVPADGDNDGMPDSWEQSHGLDPASAADAHRVAANGYTNLENYLNALAGDSVQ